MSAGTCRVCGGDDRVITCDACAGRVCHEHAAPSGTCALMWDTTRHWCDATASEREKERCRLEAPTCYVCGSDDSVISCEFCDGYVCHEHATYSATYGGSTCAPMQTTADTVRFWCDSAEDERVEERRRLERSKTGDGR